MKFYLNLCNFSSVLGYVTMVCFVCPVRGCESRYSGFRKMVEHWRLRHERTVKLHSCVHCKKTFRTRNLGKAHTYRLGNQHWVQEIRVSNMDFVNPGTVTLANIIRELSPREKAAEERRANAIVPGAELLVGRSGNSVNRDEEVVMEVDGTMIRQRKLSANAKKRLCSPAEPVVLDYFDEFSLE